MAKKKCFICGFKYKDMEEPVYISKKSDRSKVKEILPQIGEQICHHCLPRVCGVYINRLEEIQTENITEEDIREYIEWKGYDWPIDSLQHDYEEYWKKGAYVSHTAKDIFSKYAAYFEEVLIQRIKKESEDNG